MGVPPMNSKKINRPHSLNAPRPPQSPRGATGLKPFSDPCRATPHPAMFFCLAFLSVFVPWCLGGRLSPQPKICFARTFSVRSVSSVVEKGLALNVT